MPQKQFLYIGHRLKCLWGAVAQMNKLGKGYQEGVVGLQMSLTLSKTSVMRGQPCPSHWQFLSPVGFEKTQDLPQK